MSWLKDPDLIALEEDLGNNPNGKFQIRHSNVKKTANNQEYTHFDHDDIIPETEKYSINETGDIFLKKENPGLFAVKNRSLPKVVSPTSSIRKNKQYISNLSTPLSTKPLSKLKPAKVTDIVQREVDEELKTIDFQEEPIAYFSKRKDGRGHRFIYLVYTGDKSNPEFSPYSLRKAIFSEVGKEYFTMSASGVTHIHPDGQTETISLEQFAREESLFKALRKLSFFSGYYFWRPFTMWKKFVMHQRFSEIQSHVLGQSCFRNPHIFQRCLHIFSSQTEIDILIRSYLLAFVSQKQYKLVDFISTNNENHSLLKAKFGQYLNGIVDQIGFELYSKLADPKLAEVTDDSFWNGRTKNPSSDQLYILERKKANLRMKKTMLVNQDIISIGGFIRMVDYMILSQISMSCISTFVENDLTISEGLSSVFCVEAYFNETGGVGLRPSLYELIESVEDSMNSAISLLGNLPRLLQSIVLQPLINDCGIDLETLFMSGPTFQKIISIHNHHQKCYQHIVEIVTQSFDEAFDSAQSISDFYRVFLMGQNWDVKNYLKCRSGEKYSGKISDSLREGDDDGFLLSPDKEPVVDFLELKKDIDILTEDDTKVSSLRQRMVKGAIYIDMREIRESLLPIPSRCLNDIKGLLYSLINMKVSLLENVLKNYGKTLKQEPFLLESFVTLCSMVKRTKLINPSIQSEIQFVEQANRLMDGFGSAISLSSLISLYHVYQNDQKMAEQMIQNKIEQFIEELKVKIIELEVPLKALYQKISTFPKSILESSTNNLFDVSMKRKEKVIALHSRIKEVVDQQKTIGIAINNFDFYKTVVEASDYAITIYQALLEWQTISDLINNTPFMEIDVKTLCEQISALMDQTLQLKAKDKSNLSLLNELSESIEQFYPYIGKLLALISTKMKQRHWIKLFEDHHKNGQYHNKITISELINLGILESLEKIEAVSATAMAESEIEGEYEIIKNKWEKLRIQTEDTPILNEDTLYITKTLEIISSISESTISLVKILSVPFSASVRASAINLVYNLDSFEKLINNWTVFQNNRRILAAIFSNSDFSHHVSHQLSLYEQLTKKWNIFAQHCIKDLRAQIIMEYPNVLITMNELNTISSQIYCGFNDFLDSIRSSSHRLYFLSNFELLSLYTSLNDSSLLSRIYSKLFMGIQKLDYQDHTENRSMNRVKVTGLVGESGDLLTFVKPLAYDNSVGFFLNSIISSMKESVQDMIGLAVQHFYSNHYNEWLSSTPIYIAMISLSIISTKEIEDCLKSLEFNPKAVSDFEANINRRINDTMASYLPTLQLKDHTKLSTIATFLQSIKDRVLLIHKIVDNYSSELAFTHTLRHYGGNTGNDISIMVGTKQWTFGYEFWGRVPTLVFSKSIEKSYQSMCTNISLLSPIILAAPPGSGKSSLALHFAAINGKPVFQFSAYPDSSTNHLKQFFNGVINSSSFGVFVDVERFSYSMLINIFDIMAKYSLFKTDDEKLNKNKPFKIIMTMNISGRNFVMPSQLKSVCRNVSVDPPDMAKIISIQMISYGYHQISTVYPKLVSFLKTYQHIMNVTFTFAQIVEILQIAKNFLRSSSEEFSIICSIYKHLEPSIDKTVLIQMLYSAFPNSGSLSDLQEKISSVLMKDSEELLRRLIKNEINKMSIKIPINYFIEKVLLLFDLLQNHKCIIIYGPPSSGKSLLIRLLKLITERNEFQMQFQSYGTVKVEDFYYGAGSIHDIYGGSSLQNNNVYQYGLLSSYVYHCFNYGSKYQVVMKFDGEISNQFDQFLSSFLGSNESGYFTLGSSDSFFISNRARIIVETTDISSVGPSLMTKCAFISTSDQNNDLIHIPSFLFSRVPASILDTVDHDVQKSFFDHYSRFVPMIIQKTDDIQSKSMHNYEAQQYFLRHLLSVSASLALSSLSKTRKKENSEDSYLLSLSFSILYVFNNYFPDNVAISFKEWVFSTFNLSLVCDWNTINVNNDYKKEYPTPSYESLRVSQGQLTSHDIKLLENQNKNTELFITPQILPHFHYCSVLLKHRNHLLITGPPGSGKSSFIKLLLSNHSHYHPIFIQADSGVDYQSLTKIIMKFTNCADKISDSGLNVLVFENVSNESLHVLEYIRMLIDNHVSHKFSSLDPNIFETISINRFLIIVSMDNISNIAYRFLSHFVPIRLKKISDNSASFIFNSTLRYFGYSGEHSHILLNSIYDLIIDIYGSSPLTIVGISQSLGRISEKTKISFSLKVAFCEAYSRLLHKYSLSLLEEKAETLCKKYLSEELYIESIESFFSQNRIVMTRIDEIRGRQISIMDFSLIDAMEALQRSIDSHNFRCSDIVRIRITPSIIRSYALLNRFIGSSGSHILLIGEYGIGRMSLTRVYSSTKGVDLIPIQKDFNETEGKIILQTSLMNAILESKRSIFYISFIRSSAMLKRLVSFVRTNGFVTYLDEKRIQEVYLKILGTPILHLEKRQVFLDLIQQIVDNSIKIIVSLEDQSLEKLFPSSFQSIYFNYNFSEDIKSYISSCIHSTSLHYLSESLIPDLEILLYNIVEFSKQYSSNSFLQRSFSFIDRFKQFCIEHYTKIIERNKQIKSGITYWKSIKEELHTLNLRFETICPLLDALKVDTENSKNNYQIKREAAENRQKEVVRKMKLSGDEVAELEKKVSELSSKLQILAPSVDESKQLVSKISQNDIKTIRISSSNPPTPLKLLMEMFCIFIGLEPKYIPNGEALINNNDLISILLKNVSTEKISPFIQGQLESIFGNPVLSLEKLESIAPSLRLLYDWVFNLLKYTITKSSLTRETTQLNNKKLEYDSIKKESQQEMVLIESLFDSLKKEEKSINDSLLTKQTLEKEYNEVSARRNTLINLSMNSDIIISKWENEYKNFDKEKLKIVSHSIYIAFFETICSSFPSSERNSMLSSLEKAFSFLCIVDNPLSWIYHFYIARNPNIFTSNRIVMDSYDLPSEIIISLSTNRIPLVYDPERHFINYLKSLTGVLLVSQGNHLYNDTIFEGLSTGKIVIITDVKVFDPIMRNVSPFMKPWNQSGDPKMYSISGQQTRVLPGFFLVLVMNNSLNPHVDKELLTRCQVINTEYSSSIYSKSIITTVATQSYRKEALLSVLSNQVSKVGHESSYYLFENELLVLLSQSITLLNDEQIILRIQESKDGIINSIDEKEIMFGEFRDQILEIIPFIDYANLIWVTLSRYMSKICQSIILKFDDFSGMITNILNSGFNRKDSIHTMISFLFTSTIQHISQKVSIIDCISFVMILSCLNLNQKLDQLLSILNTKITEKINFVKSPLPEFSKDNWFKDINNSQLFKGIIKYCVNGSFDHFLSLLNCTYSDQILVQPTPRFLYIQFDKDHDQTQSILSILYPRFNVVFVSLHSEESYVEAENQIKKAALKGKCIVLHYSMMNKGFVTLLSKIRCLLPEANSGFKLIVLSTLGEESSNELENVYHKVYIDDFNSMKMTMQYFYNHYFSLMQSSSRSLETKKLSYVISMLFVYLFGSQNYYPILLSSQMVFSPISYPDCLRLVTMCLTSQHNGLNSINLVDLLDKIALSGCSNRIDIEHIKDLMKSILTSDIFHDGYCMLNNGKQKWKVPGDVTFNNIMQAIQKLPTYFGSKPFGLPQFASRIRDWNISRSIILRLLKLKQPQVFDTTSIIRVLQQLRNRIPKTIQLFDQKPFESIKGRWFFREIMAYNNAILIISSEIDEAFELIRESKQSQNINNLMIDTCPESWKSVVKFLSVYSINRIINHLHRMKMQLQDFLLNSVGNKIDFSLLIDIRGLLYSHLCEISLARNISSNLIDYVFELFDTSQNTVPPEDLLLTGLFVFNAKPNGDLIENLIGNEKSPFSNIPFLLSRVVRPSSSNQYITIPLYNEFEIGCNHEESNFITNIKIKSTINQETAYRNRIALYCKLSDYLI